MFLKACSNMENEVPSPRRGTDGARGGHRAGCLGVPLDSMLRGPIEGCKPQGETLNGRIFQLPLSARKIPGKRPGTTIWGHART